MEVTFDVNKLDGMKRGELQKLCKSVGIKANSKNAQLIEALKEYASQFSGKSEGSSVCQEQQSQNTPYSVEVNEAVKETETTDGQQDDADSDNFKKQLMDQLDKKVEEKMPVECKIPRFVQFMNKDSSEAVTNKTPAAKWNKIHQSQFEKMDSIDVYLEKKRKRMEGFNQSVKRAKTVVDACKSGKENSKTPTRKSTGVTRKSQAKPAEVTFKPIVTSLNKSATFVFGSPAAKPFFQPGNRQPNIAMSAATSGKKLKLKSPEVFKPIMSGSAANGGKPKTPVTRKSFAATATAGENKPKTPANPARKSTAVTPFRFLPANVPSTPTPTPRKKFDLQASLAKPLSYKPHTGKLKPVSSYKEECRPTVSEAKLKSRKVDVKNAKVTSREERRMKGVKNRENKKANALSRRRGLAC
ncbi:hypothetical protein ACROYT_G035139 [Oculina patagonica]